MMPAAEESAAAGLMAFFDCGVAPLALILYLAGARAASATSMQNACAAKPAAINPAGGPSEAHAYLSQINEAMRPVTPSRR